METPKEFMNRNGSGADECYWMLVEIGNGVDMDAIDKAMMAYAKYYHEQQVKSVDLADVVGQGELLHKLLQHLSDEDELIGNRTHQEIIDNFNQLG